MFQCIFIIIEIVLSLKMESHKMKSVCPPLSCNDEEEPLNLSSSSLVFSATAAAAAAATLNLFGRPGQGHFTKILPPTTPPTAKCNHEGCGQVLSMPNFATFSLWRHLKRCHPNISLQAIGTLESILSEADEKKKKIAIAFAECGIPMSVVDHPSFRAAFGSTIPSGLDRKALQHEIVSMAVEVKGEVRQNLQNKDGGTLIRKRLLNVLIACNENIYFWKSVCVYHLDTSTITHILQDVVAELASQKVFCCEGIVLSMVADNASAMQSAMNSFTAASRDHDVDNDDETPEALLENLCSFEGVFIFRCAAHYLQCMKDIQKISTTEKCLALTCSASSFHCTTKKE